MENQATVKQQSILDEIMDGLRQEQKQLPSKFFYDERGSKLFEQITRLEEYYLTRAETAILNENIAEITNCIGPQAMVIELGSGSSSKTRLLLDRLSDLTAYVPVDISEEYLLKVVQQLRVDYPHINVQPVFADYTSLFDLPDINQLYQKQVIFYPGSTIGNFDLQQARSFLSNLASLTDDDAGMVIGVDLKKDIEILNAAYNDAEGVTAKFNKNMLVRLNREFDATFDLESFGHHAFYNEEEGRIEMHLVSRKEQQVQVAGEIFQFEEGESIHTENSYKYSLEDFKELVSDWFTVDKVWTDNSKMFSLQFLTKK